MIRTAVLALALLSGTFTNINAQQQQKQIENLKTMENIEPNFNPEQIAVMSTIEKMVKSFQNKDIEGILSTYEPDAIVMFEPQLPVVGLNDLRQAFSEFVAINPQYYFSGHEIYISGNIATHIAPWTMTGYMPDGTKLEQSGLSVAVLKKQENGTWLIIQDNPHGQFLLNY